jgi:hypothetical protein
MAFVQFMGIADGIEVKAMMVIEVCVLVVDDSGNEFGRDVLKWYPFVVQLKITSLLLGFDMAEQHQRRERDRNSLEE